jgi:tetratricopeptide (TPR) repeat protein
MNKFPALAAACLALAVISCKPDSALSKIMTIEGRMESKGLLPSTIAEIKEGIALYEKEVERTVEASGKIGYYYKLLAMRYLDEASYGEALTAAKKAIEYAPTNPNLFYIAAVCSAYMAKAEIGLSGDKGLLAKAEYYRASEAGYLRALELEPRNTKAMYGLAVLYVYELDRAEEAESYLNGILDIEKNNVDAMFLRASVYYLTGRYEDAANEYDRIISITKVSERKKEAERNKAEVLEILYGGGSKK